MDEGGVSLISRQEFADHLLYIGVTCAGSHHQEGSLGLRVFLHLLLHLLLVEFAPSLLNEELGLQLGLILIFALVLGLLPDFVLIQLSIVTLLNRFLLVLNGGVKCLDTVLSLLIVPV